MPDFSFLLSQFSDPHLIAVAICGALAGVTRGFSGFGAALVYVPLVSAAYSPPIAAASIYLISMLFAAPFTLPAFTRCDWRSVAPLAIAASATVPLGAAALKYLDPVTMRWILAVIVGAGVVMLGFGGRYYARPSLPVTLGVGSVAGLLGGAAQMSGPPVVLYWLNGTSEARVVRANLMVFFTLTAAMSGATYYIQGLFTPRALTVAAVAGPTYAIGMFFGWRLFGLASDKTFRRIAILIVALSAVAGLPIFDRFYR